MGVSGVYKLTNKKDPSRFYIGSSMNLGRRMNEYQNLILGIRREQSASEREIAETRASLWSLDFLYITTPHLSLVYEQYALIVFKPTINKYFNISPKIYPKIIMKENDPKVVFDQTIIGIEKLLSFFVVGSKGYIRLKVFLKAFMLARDLKYELEDLGARHSSILVFVYEHFSDKDPIIYSSINKALNGLQISYGNLIDHAYNPYLYNFKYIITFEPVDRDTFDIYKPKPPTDNQMHHNITLYNSDNDIAYVFKSAREMSRYFKIDAKIVRAAVQKGEYLDFTLVLKLVSFRKTIFVFDCNTDELIETFTNSKKALNYAKVHYYKLVHLINTGECYNGKKYSYVNKV